MPIYRTEELFNLKETLANSLFLGREYPFQVLDEIENFILQLGPKLPKARFDEIEKNVWLAKTAKVAKSAFLGAPCIIDEEAEVRHCAFIRGAVIVGKNAVVGNSTEIKNSILFNMAQVPHFNYVGDSVLGFASHFGAGVITTNIKSNKSPVFIKCADETLPTNRKKVGTFAGDYAEVGCNTALCPGCVLGQGSIVYPTSHVRGQVPHRHIFKGATNIVPIK